MRICALILICIFAIAKPVEARQMERLSRGLMAIHLPGKGVYLGWRLLESDPKTIAFDVYRDGKKVNPTPLTGPTSLLDAKGTSTSHYTLRISGAEEILAETTPWEHPYITIPLTPPAAATLPDGIEPEPYVGYEGSAGDLDGDGDYELVFKWKGIAKDSGAKGYTSPTILEAIELDGSSLWRIDLGINIRSGEHYTPFLVFDLDGDGKAEVVCRTADGTVDGKGKMIGDSTKDYRRSDGLVLSGPELLTVFNGQTGTVIDTVPYEPSRGEVTSWGGNANSDYRPGRHLACIAYLDGKRPSAVFGRGCYRGRKKSVPGRTAIAAWDLRDGKLVKRWKFDTLGKQALKDYIGQGTHSIAVGDVDGDGKDEILYGAMAVDDDGSPLYTTKLGHGDAHHFGDFDPSRPGLEFFMPHEYAKSDGAPGMSFRDAGTGEILWSVPVVKWADIGRGACADIWAGSPGAEAWVTGASNFAPKYQKKLFSCKGEVVGPAPATSPNFFIWWDGDLTREILNMNWIAKYNPKVKGAMDRIFTAEGYTCFTGTKATPILSADLLGDWREEVIFVSPDSTSFRLYTTIIPTEHRIPTLMHDPIYRLSVAWQNVAYNQPPHTGKTLADMVVPAQ